MKAGDPAKHQIHQIITRGRTMSAIIPFPVPGEVLFEPVKKKSPFALREPIAVRLSPSLEPGQQLWKLSAQAVSSKFATIELFVLALFLAVSLVGVTSCITELAHLLQSDAVGQVAIRAIAGGAQ
jgi:hypothetical protein